MKTQSFQRLRTGYAISIVLLLFSLVVGYTLWMDLKENIGQTESLYKVIHQMDKVLYNQSSCEANVRGYMITQEDHFLKEYKSSSSLLRNELFVLAGMEYGRDVNRFNKLLEERMKVMDEKVRIIQQQPSSQAALNILIAKGRRLTESIIAMKSNVEKHEMRLLKQRNIEINKDFTYAKYVFVFSVVLTILMGLMTLAIAMKYLHEKQMKVDELKKLDENKNKFFSLISHDLKAPVSRMVNLGKMLTHSYHFNLQKDMEEILQMNQTSANKLKVLIDDLLTWGRLQMEKISYNPEEVNIHITVEKVVSVLEDLATAKKVDLVNNTDPGLSVYADTMMVETVLRNILQNAIKYSKEDSKISFDSRIIDNQAEISVIDSGIGMKPERIAQLMKADGIISIPGTAKEEGSGLGLILCKEFIERNRGTIKVESSYGIGTTVKISLPMFTFETLYKDEHVL